MRDDFSDKIKNNLAKRAAYICSKIDCRRLTIAPSLNDESSLQYIGCAAHITAASKGGPRYDKNITPKERGSIENGIYLCRSCADMIDKNGGIDFPKEILIQWKKDHEFWIKENLNKEFGGSISDSIDLLRKDFDTINQIGTELLSSVDRTFELQKNLKSLAIAVELNEAIKLSVQDRFVFLLHVRCDVGKYPSFFCGNMFPCDEKQKIILGGQELPKNPIEAGWTINPNKILSQVSRGLGDHRKTFISRISANGHEDLSRIIDLEDAHLHFYISNPFYKAVSKVYIIVNEILIEEFNPNELEIFPATTTLKSGGFDAPQNILNRLSNDIIDFELYRFGRKGGDPNNVKMGFPDIESSWKIKFPQLLKKVNNISEIR